MHLVSNEALPRAEVHCGGFNYAREVKCYLSGVETHQERLFSKGNPDRATRAAQVEAYRAAPAGTALVVIVFLDPDQIREDTEATEETWAYVKREGGWELIPS